MLQSAMDIEPFRIHVPGADLDDLAERLARTRWPTASPAPGWAQGTEITALRELLAQWRRFDWRATETRLNLLPHFRADVDGQQVHFIHQRAAHGRGGRPLILTHGWPGSFTEFLPLLPLLTAPGAHGGSDDDAFDVVIPSLPGYGFSSAPRGTGCGPRAIAGLWAQLMQGLGYERFIAQGGDWGASVSTCLAQRFPQQVAGVHLNFIPGTFLPWHEGAPSGAEQAFLAAKAQWADAEGGYGHIQGTRPQTLAYALTDSPAGLAAWIVEKFRAWSDCEGELGRAGFDTEALLTNLSIYWFTGCIGPSMRLYWETRLQPLHFSRGETIAVPAAVAVFPKDLPMPPRCWVERVFTDLRRWTVMPGGGHFAALERPGLMADDLRAFARSLAC
jgi:pimeloyl-ACP methyl ester carboxylesterase